MTKTTKMSFTCAGLKRYIGKNKAQQCNSSRNRKVMSELYIYKLSLQSLMTSHILRQLERIIASQQGTMS